MHLQKTEKKETETSLTDRTNILQRKRIEKWLDEQQAARDGASLDDDAIAFAKKAWQSRK